tara:strand:+ start:663 stop:1316 length:654 start_codon:yes stop_codon:yes gene_type:complete
MDFFLDSTDFDEIKRLNSFGIIDGLTTNPSLIYKAKTPFEELIKNICNEIKGPVSVESVADNSDLMIEEGVKLSKMAKNIVVKLPMTWDGIKACKELSSMNIKVNVTLCFSTGQAILAAKAGATYISPFIGRLDDANIDGIELIREIKKIYSNYNFNTKILAASIRTKNHISQSAIAGADVATIPPKVFDTLVNHNLTDKGLEIFNSDWEKSGQKIL